MFGKKPRRRRSEVRLGVETVNFETTAVQSTLTLMPLLKFWHQYGHQINGILILALLGWALYLLFTTPLFFVYGADIKGSIALSDYEIYTASQIDSQSIFWVNPAEVEQKVKALPNIKAVSVVVSLPAQVRIEVVERRPQLLWQTGETIWWVDAEGVIVPPKSQVEDMLKIIDDDLQPLEVGYQIDAKIVEGAQALRLLAPEVAVIRHTRARGLIAATPEGWPVYLGDGSQMKAKLLVLSALLPQLREEEPPPLYIDLRDPLRPVYKLEPKPPLVIPQPALPGQFPIRPFGPPATFPPVRGRQG